MDDHSPIDDHEIDEEGDKEDFILASFLYEKFKYTFDLAHNPEYLQDEGEKDLDFEFENIEDDEDWKLVVKIKGNFVYSNGTELEMKMNLMKYEMIGPNDAITEDNRDKVIQLSTVELSSVKSPYRVFLTCTDCQDVLTEIGEANNGLYVTEDVVTYDTISADVHDNGDGTFTMSMIVLLYNNMEYSEITSMYNDEMDEMEQSNSSEKDIDLDVTIKEFIGSKFNQNLQNAQMIEPVNSSTNGTHKYLV